MLYSKIQPQSFLGSGEKKKKKTTTKKRLLKFAGMAAILIYGPWPYVQIFNSPLTEGSMWSLKKFGPRVSKEKSFKDVNGRTDGGRTMEDGRGVITIAQLNITKTCLFKYKFHLQKLKIFR